MRLPKCGLSCLEAEAGRFGAVATPIKGTVYSKPGKSWRYSTSGKMSTIKTHTIILRKLRNRLHELGRTRCTNKNIFLCINWKKFADKLVPLYQLKWNSLLKNWHTMIVYILHRDTYVCLCFQRKCTILMIMVAWRGDRGDRTMDCGQREL